MKVDLNADLGESFGRYRLGLDEEVMKYITSANVATGWHAGDPLVMRKTVKLAKENGVAVGAHPGYPDLLGFGRRYMKLTYDEARNYILYQVGALYAFVRAEGIELQHVKPHGALYNALVEGRRARPRGNRGNSGLRQKPDLRDPLRVETCGDC